MADGQRCVHADELATTLIGPPIGSAVGRALDRQKELHAPSEPDA